MYWRYLLLTCVCAVTVCFVIGRVVFVGSWIPGVWIWSTLFMWFCLLPLIIVGFGRSKPLDQSSEPARQAAVAVAWHLAGGLRAVLQDREPDAGHPAPPEAPRAAPRAPAAALRVPTPGAQAAVVGPAAAGGHQEAPRGVQRPREKLATSSVAPVARSICTTTACPRMTATCISVAPSCGRASMTSFPEATSCSTTSALTT